MTPSRAHTRERPAAVTLWGVQMSGELSAEDREDLRRIFDEFQAEREGRWMRWSPSRRPAPKGMVRLVDHPDTEFRIYIVRLRFTTDDGAPIDRDEIVWPGVGFWIGRPLRPLVFEYGYLEPLNDVTLAWNCPCGRFWATRGAFEAHGCCDAPDEEQSQPVPSGAAPRVPTGLKVRSRWRLTWRTVKSEFHRGKDYTEISNWFRRLHPDHAVSARTMEDIIKAGDAGLLD